MTRRVSLMGIAAVGGVLALAAIAPARAAGLRIIQPQNGATVREKVRVAVPRATVPTNGFVALYVDGRFVLAQSPSRKPTQPVAFIWDTKGDLAETHGTEKSEMGDGPHTLEVRSYTNAGDLQERTQIRVIVDNTVDARKGQPVRLAYRFRVGDSTPYLHRVEVSAAPTSGAGAVAPGTSSQLKQFESAKVNVFVEDVVGGAAFMRERRESPVTISINEQRQPVAVDGSSRYFEMDTMGQVQRTKQMERERRHPIVNVIRLPGRSVRVGETWQSTLRIGLGNFVPEQIVVARATNKLEGVVWEHGRPSAKIKSTYDGTAKLSLATLGIPTGDYKFKGTSTILFAPSLGKVLRAEHSLDGDLTIDLLQAQSGQVGPNSSGGFAPSLFGGGGPPGMGGYDPRGGGSPYAPPGAAPGGVPGGYGAPGGVPGGYGAPGGVPGGYGAPGGVPGGYGAPGMGGGYGGGYGGYDPSGGYGGSTAPQTTQTYKTKINVVTAVAV